MNNITPKEAIANLNHIYGMVAPDIQRSLDVAIKALERPTGDLISREALKETFDGAFFDDEDDYKKSLRIIDNAPTVDIKDELAGAYNEGYMCGSREAEKASGFEDGYRHGYRKAKEDVAKRIKEQYNEHHELIPYWLSIGDVKGGSE